VAAAVLAAAAALVVAAPAAPGAGFGGRAANGPNGAAAHAVFKPRPVTAPRVHGEAVELETLTGDVGAWERQPERYERQWLRCDAAGAGCGPIPGATGPTYVLQPADVGHRLRLRVIARNQGGEAVAASAPTAIVAISPLRTPPEATTPPAIHGSPAIGATLTATEGTWAGGPATETEIAWLRCDAAGEDCAPIRGASAATYVVREDDAGVRLRVRVTKRNLGGEAVARSAPTAAVPAPVRRATIHGCRHPATGAPIAATGGWSPVTLGPPALLVTEDRCAVDGQLLAALSVSENRVVNGDLAGWRFTAPPGTRIRAIALRRAARLRGLTVGERSHYQLVGSDRPGLPPEWSFHELVVWYEPSGVYPPGVVGPALLVGVEDDPLAAENRITADGLDATWIEARVRCAHNVPQAPCTGEVPDYARLRLFATAVTLEDTSPPAVVRVGGPLATASEIGSTGSVEVEATDAGLGLYRAKLLVDGVRAGDVRPLGTGACADADPGDGDPYDFLVAVPCPTAVTAPLTFDLGDLPAGRHRVTLVLEDAGGNETVALDRDIALAGGA
jgi:hypothetical protein